MTELQKEKIVALAKNCLGKPYKLGATLDEAPEIFDCSSFTQWLFNQAGIEIPRSSLLQAGDKKGQEVAITDNFSNLEIGDLVFMRSNRGYYTDELFEGRKLYIGHVAMYIGGGKVINSRLRLNGVVIQDLGEFSAEPNYEIQIIKRF